MSKEDFTLGLLESSERVKRGYVAMIGNLGKIIAFITLAVSALVIFTDISFYDIGTASVSSGTLILLIGSYLMYFSLEDAGEQLGEQSEEFKIADGRFKRAVEKIRPERITALREFCAKYSEQELEYRRECRIAFLESKINRLKCLYPSSPSLLINTILRFKWKSINFSLRPANMYESGGEWWLQ